MPIIFRPPYSLSNLPTVQVVHAIKVDQFRASLAKLKDEWIQATNGNMERVALNLDTLFDDIDYLININRLEEPTNCTNAVEICENKYSTNCSN